MSQNFLSCDREQELLLPPSLREWLAEDHLAWFVLDAVQVMDLGDFYGAYRTDGWGRAAHEPGHEDVAFRVICANRIPDHTTIARFRVRHERALAETFTSVLALCAKAGLVSVGTVALDGTLIAGNASRAATRTHAAIREEVEQILAEAGQADAAEDAAHGEARGDELPEQLADRRSRIERLRRCRERLEAEQSQAHAAHEENLRWRAQWETENGRKLGGRKPTPPDPDALAARKINTTDPDTRLLCRRGKTPVQGYNAQAVASPEQIILAADITQQSNDSGQLEPMITTVVDELQSAGITGPLDVVLADGGYWNSRQITNLRGQGMQPIVPTKAATRTQPRTLSARQGPEAERIEQLLQTPDGAALYRRRQQLIEPVFANTKFLRGIDRFQRRGLAACKAEWKLIAATHNLLKLWRATKPALTG